MEEKYPWIKKIIENQESMMESKYLTPLYTKLNFLLLTKKFEPINYIFNNIDTKKAHEALLVVLLRTTYKQRNKITKWKEVFKETNLELDKRGVDLELKL